MMDEHQEDRLSTSADELSSIASDASFIIEHRLDEYHPQNTKDDTVCVLRAFLNNLPDDGRKNMLADIKDCKDDNVLRQLALSLTEGLLFPMRTHPTTPSITPSPRFGVEDSIEDIASKLVEPATRGTQQKWLKKACLSRDNDRCVLTGAIETTSKSAKTREHNEKETLTECAHIIPFSLGNWKSDEEHYSKSQVWVNLNRCFPSLRTKIGFTQETINDPYNAMTMNSTLHHLFGLFIISLEATDKDNTYLIKNYKPSLMETSMLPQMATFINHDARYELPNPILLEVHAIIARILHATGKAEEADKLRRDKDDTGVLASDGSTDVTALLSVTSLSALSSRPTGNIAIDAQQQSETTESKAQANRGGRPFVDMKKENTF